MNPEVSSRTGNFIRKIEAVALIGLVSVSAACGNPGRGKTVGACKGYSSDILVTNPGDKNYKRDTDPEVLLKFARDPRVPGGLYILDHSSSDFRNDDKLDKLGEFECLQDDPQSDQYGNYVLTFDGERWMEVCADEGIPNYYGQPPVKQYCY